MGQKSEIYCNAYLFLGSVCLLSTTVLSSTAISTNPAELSSAEESL